MTRAQVRVMMEKLMEKHGNGDAWDEKQFNDVFDLFEEDDPAANQEEGKVSGLDKGELLNLVKRIAQL